MVTRDPNCTCMQPHLQGVERESALDRNDELAVKHKVFAASHFSQEDVGPELAAEIVSFVRRVT